EILVKPKVILQRVVVGAAGKIPKVEHRKITGNVGRSRRATCEALICKVDLRGLVLPIRAIEGRGIEIQDLGPYRSWEILLCPGNELRRLPYCATARPNRSGSCGP